MFRKKTSNRYRNDFLSHHKSISKRWRRYWNLMFKKKYRRKLNRKFKRKYKGKIRGRGFGDGFKLLYSLRNQWPKSMQWGDKILKNFKRNIKILKCGYCQKTACQSWHQKFLVSCKYCWEAFCKACIILI